MSEMSAKELVKPYCTEADDHDYPQSECNKCAEMARVIQSALDVAELRGFEAGREKEREKLADVLALPEKWRRWATGGQEDCPHEGCQHDENGGENHEHDCCCHLYDECADELDAALSKLCEEG